MNNHKAAQAELAQLRRTARRAYAYVGALITLTWVAYMVMDFPR